MAEAAPIVADDSPASPESGNKSTLGEEMRLGGLICESDDENGMPATMHEDGCTDGPEDMPGVSIGDSDTDNEVRVTRGGSSIL